MTAAPRIATAQNARLADQANGSAQRACRGTRGHVHAASWQCAALDGTTHTVMAPREFMQRSALALSRCCSCAFY
jgi:hypothetical protein